MSFCEFHVSPCYQLLPHLLQVSSLKVLQVITGKSYGEVGLSNEAGVLQWRNSYICCRFHAPVTTAAVYKKNYKALRSILAP